MKTVTYAIKSLIVSIVYFFPSIFFPASSAFKIGT